MSPQVFSSSIRHRANLDWVNWTTKSLRCNSSELRSRFECQWKHIMTVMETASAGHGESTISCETFIMKQHDRRAEAIKRYTERKKWR
jgi:hypothetical protein